MTSIVLPEVLFITSSGQVIYYQSALIKTAATNVILFPADPYKKHGNSYPFFGFGL
jgi:hypothetical protein